MAVPMAALTVVPRALLMGAPRRVRLMVARTVVRVARVLQMVAPTRAVPTVERMAALTVVPTVVPVARVLRTAAQSAAVLMVALTEVPTVEPRALLMVVLRRVRPMVALTAVPTGTSQVDEPGAGERVAAGRAPGSPALCGR
jgi:hypothetical protein